MAIRNLVLLIGSIIFILATSAYLTLMMLVMTPFIVVPLIYLKKYRLLSKESQSYVAEANAYANGVLSMMDTVRAYQYESIANTHFDQVIENGFTASRKEYGKSPVDLNDDHYHYFCNGGSAMGWNTSSLSRYFKFNTRRYWTIFRLCNLYCCFCAALQKFGVT